MRIARKVFINRRVGIVFGYLASAENEPEWRKCVLRTATDQPGVPGIGITGSSLIRFMGRDVDVCWKMAEFEQDTRLCREYAPGVRGGRDRYMLHSSGIGTVLEFEIEVEVDGLVGLLTAGRRRALERELRSDLHRMKAILEDR